MARTRYLNLVFQGGGVRGIAYAGVLNKKPSNYVINSVGGTSAGALVAALLAIGKSPAELYDILHDKALYNLIEDSEQARFERLGIVVRKLTSVVDKRSKKPSFLRLIAFLLANRNILNDLTNVWNSRGLHSTDKFRTWLNDILEGKTFEQIEVEDLKIVAADVGSQKYLIYSKKKNPSTPIAHAVQASASIPIFFTPVLFDDTYLVDGGLLSNFPSFLFAQAKYPTIGFRLGDITAPGSINSTVSFLRGLLLTMTEAHDKQRPFPPSFKSYDIPTPDGISATKFALTDDDVKELYDAGLKVGVEVDWKTYSSETPIIGFYDPKPQETLQLSLQQASALLRKYAKRESWVDELYNEGYWIVRIEKDWSTKYETVSTLSVKGTKQLFISQFTGNGVTNGDSGPLSLFDCKFTAEEVESSQEPLKKKENLTLIPAFNAEETKGFVLVFSPPISEGNPRHIRTQFQIDREFQRTLALGSDDRVTFSIQQAALNHRIRFEFVIEADYDLPEFECHAHFGEFKEESNLKKDKRTGRVYRRFVFSSIEAQVINGVQYQVTLQRVAEEGRSATAATPG